MKVKYILVILCLFASLSAMGQRGKLKVSPFNSPDDVVIDSTKAQDGSKAGLEDIIPENEDNFCEVLTKLMTDAGSNFERIKGKLIETVSDGSRFTAMGGIPGAVTSSLFHATARWQYEGVVYQGSSKEDMQAIYDKYKHALGNCLPAKGYVMNSTKNTSSKLDGYPDYKFTKTENGGPDAKSSNHPNAILDVEYTAGADIYVITVNVWSN